MGKKKVKGLVSGTARKGKGRLYDAFVGDGEERKRGKKLGREDGWERLFQQPALFLLPRLFWPSLAVSFLGCL